MINNTFTGQELAVVHEDGGHSARAYERGGYTFTASDSISTRVLLEKDGQPWQHPACLISLQSFSNFKPDFRS